MDRFRYGLGTPTKVLVPDCSPGLPGASSRRDGYHLSVLGRGGSPWPARHGVVSPVVRGPMIETFLNSTPWLWPALAMATAVSLLTFRPLALRLHTSRAVAFLLVLSLSGIVALTLTPGDDAFSRFNFADCFVRVARPIGLERLLNFGGRGLNVLLFVPLGAAIAALPRSRTKLVLLVGALAMPFLIEGIQYYFSALDRSCSTLDVVDNLTGLVVGLVIGAVAGTVAGRRPRTALPDR